MVFCFTHDILQKQRPEAFSDSHLTWWNKLTLLSFFYASTSTHYHLSLLIFPVSPSAGLRRSHPNGGHLEWPWTLRCILLGHDFQLLNNDRRLAPKTKGGISTALFCVQTKEALSLVEAWLGFSLGDQVIPTNDTLRESRGSLGIGWLQDDAGMHVGKCFHGETTPQSTDMADQCCIEIKNANLMLPFFMHGTSSVV